MTNPLSNSEYLVIQFDQRDGSLVVLESLGYSAYDRDDALRDAESAAAQAHARGLPIQYVVIRLDTEAVFPAHE
ncbi:hypothetical protein [Planotetraspora mira]|uniref:Uncharacterized protein n=1 Tax=Planotetraspora mira TaxID=58121 RepID=A0A8J3TV47_9ACTN|nr:hypothetical protein [Planotetraspora mira]GII33505.1 hypothetical protein Pmi06nite_69470 [Planotetraspora mira]